MFSVSEWGLETKQLCAGVQYSYFCMCAPASGGFAGFRPTFCFLPPMKAVWTEVSAKVTGVLRWADPRRSWQSLQTALLR